jgi:hypothetical protein
VPTFRSTFRVGVIEIHRDHVIRLPVGVSLREEEDTPVVETRRELVKPWPGPLGCAVRARNAPFVTTATEFRSDQPLWLLTPHFYPPGLGLKVLDFLTQVRHMFGSESLG